MDNMRSSLRVRPGDRHSFFGGIGCRPLRHLWQGKAATVLGPPPAGCSGPARHATRVRESPDASSAGAARQHRRVFPPPRGWPSERTALSQQRRRAPARRTSRTTGLIIGLTAFLVATALAGAGYLVKVRPWSPGSSAAAAAMAAVPTSHTMTLLRQRRTELIAMSAASRTLSLVGHPKLASRQPSNLPGAPPAASAPGAGAPGSGAPGSGPVVAGPPAAPPNPGTAQSI